MAMALALVRAQGQGMSQPSLERQRRESRGWEAYEPRAGAQRTMQESALARTPKARVERKGGIKAKGRSPEIARDRPRSDAKGESREDVRTAYVRWA